MNSSRIDSKASRTQPAPILLGCVLSIAIPHLLACRANAPAPPRSAEPAQQSPTAVSPPAQAPAPPVEAPPPPRRRSPASVPSSDEQIDQALANLKQGNLAYNTPTKMKTGQSAHVVASIGGGNISVSTLENGMPNGQGTQTATAATPVSTEMKMSLTSADFEITPLSSEEQIVAGGTPTTWEWEIVPRHSGTLGLHLAAVVELDNLSRDFTTVDRNVAVQVDPVNAVENFFQTNTVWVLGVIGTGILSVWGWLKKRKKSKSTD